MTTVTEAQAAKLPAFRCDNCDNGVELEWEHCAWCGATKNWIRAALTAAAQVGKEVMPSERSDNVQVTGMQTDKPMRSGMPELPVPSVQSGEGSIGATIWRRINTETRLGSNKVIDPDHAVDIINESIAEANSLLSESLRYLSSGPADTKSVLGLISRIETFLNAKTP